MPNLSQSLPAKDLGFLRIVASLWGIELSTADPAEVAIELAETMCDAELLEEIISTLPEQGQTALGALADEGGRMTWVNFTRRFGDVREMGAGRRDREQPHQRPNSGAEMLWYRALVAKAFFETDKGPIEFAYIPDDLREALTFIGFSKEEAPEPEEAPDPAPAPPPAPVVRPVSSLPLKVSERPPEPPAKPMPRPTPQPAPVSAHVSHVTHAPEDGVLGRPASPVEKSSTRPATDRILDDACTLLAALRMGLEEPYGLQTPASVLSALLHVAGLLENGLPRPEPVKTFLEMPRKEALQLFVQGWRASREFNELRQVPGLICEGGWQNQPHETREAIQGFLAEIPNGQWWSIAALTRDVKNRFADFQRPAGDYDSWFIRRSSDGVFLRGFGSWDEVDGALLHYHIQLLHWLGQLDLASTEPGGPPTALRKISSIEHKEEKGKLVIASNGRISIERLVPRVTRYQVARFCAWEESSNPEEYRYLVTAQSLKRAADQGLKVSHLLGLLARQPGVQAPPSFVKMLQRWESNGTEARLQTVTVLRVSRPDVLEELRKSKAARFLGEILGPTTIAIQAGATAKVQAALTELGLLAEEISAD